jgi:hypothetical protein
LTKIDDPSPNVASHQVRVHALEVCGIQDVACEHNIAKARGEAFNLRLNPLEHVDL